MLSSRSGSYDPLISIGCGPIEFARESIESCRGVFKICRFPDRTGISPSFIDSSVAVVTIVIARKGDIVRIDVIPFNYNL